MATQVKTGLIANNAITDAKIANVAITGVTASSGDSSTALATTAFVAGEINSLIDAAPGALNTLNELAAAMGDDANFSTTVTNSIATKLPLAGGTLTGTLAFGDNTKLKFGNSQDLEIYHDGSHSYIDEVGTGNLYIRNGTKNSIFARSDGEIILYHNGSGKLSTTSTGVNISGNLVGTTAAFNSGSTNISATFTSTDGLGGIQLADNNGNVELVANGNNFEIRNAGGSPTVNVLSNGNVGIGTGGTNPGDRLVVQKDSANLEPMLVLKNDNTTDDNGASIDFSGKDTSGNNIIFGRLQNKYTNHATEKSHLIFFNRNDSGTLTEGLRINHDMRIIVNGGTFPSLPTGSTLNVFGDGETLRLDGSGNTSKTLRFRGVSTSNPAIITADGSLEIGNEDANTSISLMSIKDIIYKTTKTNSTAGNHTFYSYNTPIFKLDGGNNYAELRGGSDVRMVFGSTGTPTNNTSNWIRGASSNLMYNTPGVHIWELSGTARLQIDSNNVLRVGQSAVNSSPGHVYAAGTLVTEAATSKNHRIIQRGYQDASGNITGNANYTEFYEYGSFGWYTNVNTAANSRTYGMSLYDNTLKIADYGYNSNSGVIHYGGTGRTFMDINYNSYGAEIILVNNRTASGICSVLQYRTNGVTEGSVRGTSSGLSFYNNSDYRKKEDIRDLTGSLDVINSLQPRLYKYKPGFGKPTRDFVGFVAHEIQEKMPNLVDVEKDAVYTQQDIDDGASHVEVGDPKYQTVAYSDNEMITRLVGAIQEQQTIIDDLKSRIETLEE